MATSPHYMYGYTDKQIYKNGNKKLYIHDTELKCKKCIDATGLLQSRPLELRHQGKRLTQRKLRELHVRIHVRLSLLHISLILL